MIAGTGGISAPFIRRPIATSLLMIGILFVGLVAYPRLPVAPLPQVDFPTIQVSAQLPGASPETMASSVAQPLERQFAQIPGVSQMTSTSALGTTTVTVQFDLDRNIDAAAQDIQAAINAAGGQLPKNLPSPPTYKKVNPADTPILIIAAQSDTLPLTEVDDNVDTMLAQQLSQVSGVAQVSIGGRAEAGGAHPARSGEAGQPRPVPRGRAGPDRARHGRQPEGQHRRPHPQLHHLRQRSADRGGSVERRDRGLPQRRADPHPRHRPGRRRPGGRQKGRLGQRQTRRVPDRVQAARRQRHRHR